MHINLFLAFCVIFFYSVDCKTVREVNENFGKTKDPLTIDGRSVMVHLFEWKWSDIAKECERFLGPKGFGGIQISPPNEHAIKPCRPWWERYQPVSYKLISRSGNESEFIEMVERCNAAGVRIYVDAVINHMGAGCCESTGHSEFDADKLWYPAIPYKTSDFNKCNHNIEGYGNEIESRDCKLFGLPDLVTGKESVRAKIAEFLNHLVDIGVAGFRIDAAKHIWPEDLEAIFKKVKDVRSDVFGPNKRPFVYQEVTNDNEQPGEISHTEYLGIGRVTEFKYGKKLSEVVRKENNQQMKWLVNWGVEWGFMADGDAIAFIDNHDTQRSDHHILSFHDSKPYKIAASFMLAWPYGIPQILSSYKYDRNDQDSRDKGPPTLYSVPKDVKLNPDNSCGNDWICEHRWIQLTNMVAFRNIAGNQPVENWWDNHKDQIAFSRGDKAFIAINNDDHYMDEVLQTSLPAGTYCDVITGDKINNTCTGKTVTVNDDGTAKIQISSLTEDPIIAFHVGSKL